MGALTRSLFNVRTPAPFIEPHLLFKLFIISFGAFKSGNFSIQASEGVTLVITYIGYAEQRLNIGSDDNKRSL